MARLSAQARVVLSLAVVVVLLFGAALVYNAVASSDGPTVAEQRELVVRADSHRLDDAGDDAVTLVEFLDLECESCAAAFPFVEQLREQYAGRVTFVVRYFPIPSHQNGRNAAHAVEAAARQDQLEPMYRRMYETQAQWGESTESKAALFRTYAEDLGLDLAQYDADVDSPEVAARVQSDVDDGTDLGVTGTPTFFLDGERLAPATTEEFVQAIEGALAENA